MSDFEPHAQEEIIPGHKDILHGGVSPDALYSVKLQNPTPDVQQDYNSYYICTPGIGFSIEIEGKLGLGKFTEKEMREKLKGRVFLQSSVRSIMGFSRALAESCKLSYNISEHGNQYYLTVTNQMGEDNKLLKTPERKVIRVWNNDEVIRPLASILHWERHGTHRVCDMTADGVRELREAHKDLPDDEWPAPGESIVLLLHGEKIHITHEDHMNIINPDFFKTGLGE